MKIAIPTTDGRVEHHLGKCQRFLIADVDGERILSERWADNPGHGPAGPPPAFVRDQGVELVLAWGMPEHAQQMFERWGIRFVLGATGEPRAALEAYLAGTLARTDQGLDGGGGCGCDCGPRGDHAH